MSDAPEGPLSAFLESVADAVGVINEVLDQPPSGGGGPGKSKLTITEDHRGRWFLVPNG